MVDQIVRCSGKRSSHWWTWEVVGVAMYGNTRISRTVNITLPWEFLWVLVAWTMENSRLHDQGIILEYQVRRWLPLWILGPEGEQRINKSQGFPILMLLFNILWRHLNNLKIYLIQDTGRRHSKINLMKIILFYWNKYISYIKSRSKYWYIPKELSWKLSERNTSTKQLNPKWNTPTK